MHPDHKKDLPLERLPQAHPEQIPMAGGKSCSSKGPALHLIPTVALEKIADRFELGIARKGDKAWNALSQNQECMDDIPFLIERCSHIIHHALKLRDQLVRGVQPGEESMTDNATAVGWGAIFMTCAAERMNQSKAVELDLDPSPFEKPNMSARSALGLPKSEPALCVEQGKYYKCKNGTHTGQIVKLHNSRGTHYAGSVPDVVWSIDGEPVASNMDLSPAQLKGYTISHECL